MTLPPGTLAYAIAAYREEMARARAEKVRKALANLGPKKENP